MSGKFIWVIAGTGDGRMLINDLVKLGINVHVSVATDYGAGCLQPIDDLQISSGRMDYAGMYDYIMRNRPTAVVDATHPYATAVTENIHKACTAAGTVLFRLHRHELPHHDQVLYLEDMRAAVDFLQGKDGNVLLTTGSKDLETFCAVRDYKKRIHLRILPMVDSLSKALKLGYEPANIICMQGPFSITMNVALLKNCKAKYMVSKESGKAGGLDEKISAAQKARVKLIVVGRPQEPLVGYSAADIINKIKGMI